MRLALAVVALTACTSRSSSPGDREPPCLIDSVGALVLTWHPNAECTATNVRCRDLCNSGDADACFSRAIAIENIPGNEKESRSLFESACKLGHANGCTNWAASVWALEDEPPTRCLLRTFERTCNVGDPFGCGMAGRFRINYRIGLAPLPEARLGLETSCARLEGFPCRVLALYGDRGVFAIARDRIVELMKRACHGGDDAACGEHATVDETFSE